MPDPCSCRKSLRDSRKILPLLTFAALSLQITAAALAQETPPTPSPDTLRLAQAGVPADELDRARQLLAAGQAREAYELLAAREADWAGTPVYDYLFGIAALDSGKPGEAIFSLERVLSAEPGFAGARMELARAYFDAGEFKEARTQFQFLLTQSPPDATRAVIERYLATIAGRSRGESGVRPFVEMGVGYDSNANGSTGEQTFLGFTLNPDNVETSSGFLDVAAGLSHVKSLGPASAWVNMVRIGHRLNPDASFIDQTVGSLSSAFNWATNRTHSSAGVSGYYSLLDGSDHELGGALELATGGRVADNWDITLMLRGGPVRYRDVVLDVLEVDRYLGALTFSRLNVAGRAMRVGLSLLGGIDKEREDGSPYGNQRQGARLSSGWAMGPRSSVYTEAGFLRTNYDDSPGFFGVDRVDEEWSGLVALEWQGWPGTGWAVSPRARYVQHDSNVSLYEYDRWEVSLYFRRSFQ